MAEGFTDGSHGTLIQNDAFHVAPADVAVLFRNLFIRARKFCICILRKNMEKHVDRSVGRDGAADALAAFCLCLLRHAESRIAKGVDVPLTDTLALTYYHHADVVFVVYTHISYGHKVVQLAAAQTGFFADLGELRINLIELRNIFLNVMVAADITATARRQFHAEVSRVKSKELGQSAGIPMQRPVADAIQHPLRQIVAHIGPGIVQPETANKEKKSPHRVV